LHGEGYKSTTAIINVLLNSEHSESLTFSVPFSDQLTIWNTLILPCSLVPNQIVYQ